MPAYLTVCYLNVRRNIKMCRNTVLPVYILCVCVCVRKLMSAIEGKIWAEGVRELVAEQYIEIKGEEVTDWRKFHNEHLHDLYSIHCVLVWRSDQ